jgi:hypothetical protein
MAAKDQWKAFVSFVSALEDGWHLFRPEEEYGKVVEAFIPGY